MPSIRCCSVFAAGVFFFGGADFFFAKRLFFRYGEGCVGRASRATVGVTAKDNGGACFPLDFGITHAIRRQPSHPHRSGFFIRFMPHESPPVSALPQPTLRGSLLWLHGLQAALQAAPFACMEFSTIRHLRWRICASLRGLQAAPAPASFSTIRHLRW